MLSSTARRFAKKLAVAALNRLPRSIQLRLCCDLVALLGDHAAKVAPVLMGRMAAIDRARLLHEQAASLDGGGLAICAEILSALPAAEQGPFLHELMVRTGAKPVETFAPLVKGLPRLESASLLQHLAETLEVSAAEVTGANGALTGYFNDEGIFLPYLRERAWFWNAIEFINSMFVGSKVGTFIDIGANIGAVVVPIARANPSIDCFAFEPEPNNFLALAHNIARNRVGRNIHAYELALTDVDGTVTFELSGSNFGDHRVRKSGSAEASMFDEDGRMTIEVKARRLDRVLGPAELARPIVAKIDVQGAESMVLAGGETILREADMLIVEYWPYGMRRLGTDPLEFLNGFSGVFPLVAKVGEQPISRSDFVPFAAIRAELEAFAEKRTWMHLNLALMKHPAAERSGLS